MTDARTSAIPYTVSNAHLNSFAGARAGFVDGSDTPRAFLERCLEVIRAREPTVQAFVVMNTENARAAADAATTRYREGRPLSPIDGMPVGIKDVIQTRDMPTALGSPIFTGRETGMDSASVNALRLAGAAIVGKTVTTEFAFMVPGPTTNPFDAGRTPGGSSSGSAAAVGAGMLPVALGNQVVGSVIRPASYCANYAMKPTLGALHLGEGLSLSQLHVGIHAASLHDMWAVAYEIAARAGGDPGYPGLYGPADPSPERAPQTLIALETEGWKLCDDTTRRAFEDVLAQIEAHGVRVLRRGDDLAIERFEQSIDESVALCRVLCSYEMRWALRSYKETGLLSDELGLWLEMAESITPQDYRDALRRREVMRSDLQRVAPLADAMITLASPGPAPALGVISRFGEAADAIKTGSPVFNAASSALGAPAITVPRMSVDGLPAGVQLIGQPHSDWALAGHAAWLMNVLQPVEAGIGPQQSIDSKGVSV